jgi:predicted dehydrogenase
MSIAALKAGKHVACTVPMATSIEDCKKIVELVKKTGLQYMMMETVVYAREFLYMKELSTTASSASCSSSRRAISRTWTAGPTTGPACRRCGTRPTASAPSAASPGHRGVRELLRLRHDPQGTHQVLRLPLRRRNGAHQVQGQRRRARIIRSLFDVARQYRESIDVYGSKASVEWPLIEHEPLVLHTAKKPGAEDPPPGEGPGLRQAPARRPSPLHHQGRLRPRQEDAPQLHPGQPATAAATPTSPTSSSPRWSRTATRSPTPANPPTGPASVSARTSPAEGRRDRQTARFHAVH